MSTDYLELRFQTMRQRLSDTYDSLGHSSGRPYLYFVYPPGDELRMADPVSGRGLGRRTIRPVLHDHLLAIGETGGEPHDRFRLELVRPASVRRG